MISVCIITKNEQENIERCLKSLMPYEMEIIVVDTGSTDNTKDIVQRYTDKVFDFEWCDDISHFNLYSFILSIDSSLSNTIT